MDYYKFVNSKDIEKHLRKINYQLNPIEKAWLVYQSVKTTLEEKYEAWNDILETTEDCELPEGYFDRRNMRLHTSIKNYMDLNRKKLKEFCGAQDDGRYVYTLHWVSPFIGPLDNGERYDDNCAYYSSFESALQGVKEDILDYYEDDERKPLMIEIRKNEMDEEKYSGHSQVFVNQNLEIVGGRFVTELKYEDDILNETFESLWMDFPTPFKKGDILWIPGYDGNLSGGPCYEPFVAEEVGAECYSDEALEKKREGHGDYSDMNFFAYFLHEDGTIYWESSWNYMDLEYYDGKPKDNIKMLYALSEHMKGNISYEALLGAYDYTKWKHSDQEDFLGIFVPELYESIGMKEDWEKRQERIKKQREREKERIEQRH